MRLSKRTDYALRVLMYLAENHGRPTTTQQIARFHKISLNHLVKVVHHLSQAGFLEIRKGRNGGIWLAKSLEKINLREIVELCEPDFRMAECFPPNPGKCPLLGRCKLKSALSMATETFLEQLGRYNLSNVTPSK